MLLDDHDFVQRMGAAARDRAEAALNPETSAARTEGLYRELARGRVT
jgi:glycosyltransferase involved in cell wall biosynthesis